MVWHSHLFQNFPQFIVIHTVKGFDIVNKAEIDVYLELSCFFHDPADVSNLISGSSAFSKTSLNIRKFMVHILLKAGLENFEHYFISMWDECSWNTALLIYISFNFVAAKFVSPWNFNLILTCTCLYNWYSRYLFIYIYSLMLDTLKKKERNFRNWVIDQDLELFISMVQIWTLAIQNCYFYLYIKHSCYGLISWTLYYRIVDMDL